MGARTQYILLAWGLTLCLLVIPLGVLLAFFSGDWRWLLLSLPGVVFLHTIR